MFNGIVEQAPRLVGVSQTSMFRRLVLPRLWPDVALGESIAVNGVCLTIAELDDASIGFDVIRETLDKTNLGLLAPGDPVNVERAMRVGDRIDGHFVQGHVDGTGALVDQVASESEWRLAIRPPDHLRKYIIPKGSISIDGVSLTIAAIGGDTFDVALIPTTLRLTQLGSRPMGWPFNLEADILAKTIITQLERIGLTGAGKILP